MMVPFDHRCGLIASQIILGKNKVFTYDYAYGQDCTQVTSLIHGHKMVFVVSF